MLVIPYPGDIIFVFASRLLSYIFFEIVPPVCRAPHAAPPQAAKRQYADFSQPRQKFAGWRFDFPTRDRNRLAGPAPRARFLSGFRNASYYCKLPAADRVLSESRGFKCRTGAEMDGCKYQLASASARTCRSQTSSSLMPLAPCVSARLRRQNRRRCGCAALASTSSVQTPAPYQVGQRPVRL